MYSPHHQSPPPNYVYQEYRPHSYAYTPGNEYNYSTTPNMKQTSNTPRQTQRTYTYTATPQSTSFYDPPAYTYASTGGYTIRTTTAQPRRTDYDTATERLRERARRHVGSDGIKIQTRTSSSSSKKDRSPSSTQSRNVRESVVVEDKDDVYGYSYSPKGSPPPPYHEAGYENNYWSSRYFSYDTERPSTKSTPRKNTTTTTKHASTKSSRASQSPTSPTTSTSTSSSSSSKSKSSSKTSSSKPTTKSPTASPTDALRAGIPAGYSYKNWDPTEEPIYLLGSVFDANSLGKWIYDWTVFHHGPAVPMSDMAGDLWLLLIQLAGKIKRLDTVLPRVRRRADRELVEDFLEGGDRLWERLAGILKACEDCMWKAAKRRGEREMGKNSGTEFVETMFGRDRRLEETEKLMASMRLWNMRFDANCEEVVRSPSG